MQRLSRTSFFSPARSSVLALIAALLLSTVPAWSKGSPIRFHAAVVSIAQASDADAVVTVRLQSFDVPVQVNSDTEIQMHGDLVGLDGLTAGAFVSIAGFFSTDGIVAETIDILDINDSQFRLRGPIMAVGPATGGTLITLLGVDVLVNDETRLFQRGSDDPLAASELAVGLIGDVVGIFDDDQLVATRLRTGSRASEAIVVEFDGTIASIDGATLMIDTDGGGLATVLVTDETRVRGDLVVDAFVEIRGTLDENLAVVATSIKVDRDGDGDADDDHAEDEANENGGGAVVDLRRGVRFDPATGEELEGEAETEFRETPSGQGFQEVEVAFHGAGRNEAFFVRVTFASGAIVDFGEVRANGGGRVKVKFRTVGGGDTPSLSGLLPPDETARDVTRIEIINGDGTIVLTADF